VKPNRVPALQVDGIGQFARVDAAEDPEHFVEFLDLTSRTALDRKLATYRCMDLAPGARVLEVGCGAGGDAMALAERVGTSGLAVGIDRSATMIREASQRAHRRASAARFLGACATALPFANDTFTALRCERMLEHLTDPAAAIAEFRRVLQPGGRVVLYEPDWATLQLDLCDNELDQRLANFIASGIQSALIGRRLRRRLLDAGFENVTVVPDVWVLTDSAVIAQLLRFDSTLAAAQAARVLDASESSELASGLASAGARGRCLAALTFFVACGDRPTAAE